MAQSQVQSEHQSRTLAPRVSMFWWLESRPYFTFILRELTCIFVAWFVVYLLLLVRAVSQGAVSYEEFLAWSASTPILILNIVSFLMLVFHAVTFFDAAPRAMVVKLGTTPVPGAFILAGHYAAWVAASLVVAWLVLGA